MSSVNDVSGIPTAGKSLIIVAVVDHVLHFRIFDGDGKVVVDTDEKKLTEQARPIEDLRKQLESLWPPHKLTNNETVGVIAAVTSIVGHALGARCDLQLISPFGERRKWHPERRQESDHPGRRESGAPLPHLRQRWQDGRGHR